MQKFSQNIFLDISVFNLLHQRLPGLLGLGGVATSVGIQDLPDEGYQHREGGASTYYLSNFSRKCMKMKELLVEGCASLCPLDPLPDPLYLLKVYEKLIEENMVHWRDICTKIIHLG